MNRTFFAFAMQHFSLIDLKTFRAVADEGNLTRGAARVHLSPSTVCARIKGLESSLGVPLFTRSAQGMAVTPAGEIVRQGAFRIERDIDGMLRDLEPFVSREAGTLRIVSNYGAAMNFLADGLARFFEGTSCRFDLSPSLFFTRRGRGRCRRQSRHRPERLRWRLSGRYFHRLRPRRSCGGRKHRFPVGAP